MSKKHVRTVRDFIGSFRAYRGREARRADTVLGYFKQHDVLTVEGHRKILEKWATLEGVHTVVGGTHYVGTSSGYELPFPSEV